jgi:hypothetical protein
MRTLAKWALTVAAVVLLTSPASAQRPGSPIDPSALGGGPLLLIVPNVQQELKLGDGQTQALRQALPGIMDKLRSGLSNLRELGPEERTRKQRELTRSLNDEAKKALSMSDEQARRFDQIGLQQRGFEAFGDPDIQAKLKLSDEQKGKIREIGNDAIKQVQEIARDVGSDREGAMKKIRQLQRDLMVKAQAELTEDQKSAWKELTGEPFEVRFEFERRS